MTTFKIIVFARKGQRRHQTCWLFNTRATVWFWFKTDRVDSLVFFVVVVVVVLGRCFNANSAGQKWWIKICLLPASMGYDVPGAPNAPALCLLCLSFWSPRRALDGVTMRKLHKLQSVCINIEERWLESGLSLNIWITWCQSIIRSGSWTLNTDLLRALLWLMLRAAGVALRTSRKAVWVWMYADLCRDLNFSTFR